jgi:hypothetical protein
MSGTSAVQKSLCSVFNDIRQKPPTFPTYGRGRKHGGAYRIGANEQILTGVRCFPLATRSRVGKRIAFGYVASRQETGGKLAV